jgi:hypothetical protein
MCVISGGRYHVGKLNGTEKVTAMLKKFKKPTALKVFTVFFIHDASYTESVNKS